LSFDSLPFCSHDDGVDVIRRGLSKGRKYRQFAGKVKSVFAIEDEGFELARANERANDLANAGAGGKRREERLNLIFAGKNGLTEIQGDESGERRRQASVCAGFDLLRIPGGRELPECDRAIGLGNGEDAEMLPQLGEGAKSCSLGDFVAELHGEL
jgi:hypothetical protein